MANQKGIAFRRESDSRLHRCERLEASGGLCDGIERLTDVGDCLRPFFGLRAKLR